jgi:hypothetical protein
MELKLRILYGTLAILKIIPDSQNIFTFINEFKNNKIHGN